MSGKSSKTVVLGTNNPDKLREIKRLLKGSGVAVFPLNEFPKFPEAVEDGKTFVANARKKARWVSTHTKSLTLADDSGLMVFSLNGRPGVASARFAGPACSYRDNNRKLLWLLKKTPSSKRTAKFVCAMALYDNGRPVAVVQEECRGRIAHAERGQKGFGYDPVFVPDGFSKTFAELLPATKNRISHRGHALRAAKRAVLNYLCKNSP